MLAIDTYFQDSWFAVHLEEYNTDANLSFKEQTTTLKYLVLFNISLGMVCSRVYPWILMLQVN